MAPAVGEPAPAASSWSLFKPASWGKGAGGKKIKVAHLPEESSMYYNSELKRWVERGMEDAAAADPGNAPPPTTSSVFGTSLANAVTASGPPPSGPSLTMTRKAVASRYVLQNNLSVSSSTSDLADAGRNPSSGNLIPSTSSGFLPSPRNSQAGGLPAPPPKAFFLPGAPTATASPDTAAAAEDALQLTPAADMTGDKGFNFFLPGSGDMEQTSKSTGNAWAGYGSSSRPARARRNSNLGTPPMPNPPASPPADHATSDNTSLDPFARDAGEGATPPPNPADAPHGLATPEPMQGNGMHAGQAAAAAWAAGSPPEQGSDWQLPHAGGFPQQQPAYSSAAGQGSQVVAPSTLPDPASRFAAIAGNGSPLAALENQCSLGGWAEQSPGSVHGAASYNSLPNMSSLAAPASGEVFAKPSLTWSSLDSQQAAPPAGAGPPAHAKPNRDADADADAGTGAPHEHCNGHAHVLANGAGLHGAAQSLHSHGQKLLGALAGYVSQHVSSPDAADEDAWGFESAMHPGSVDKLDGPLPWELPEQLRYGDDFLSICTAWQRNNPGKLYTPELLVPPPAAAAEDGAAAGFEAVAPLESCATDSPGGAWRKGYALRKQQEEQEQGQGQGIISGVGAGDISHAFQPPAEQQAQQQQQQQQQQEPAACIGEWTQHPGFQQQYSPEAQQYSPEAQQYSPEAQQYSPEAQTLSPSADGAAAGTLDSSIQTWGSDSNVPGATGATDHVDLEGLPSDLQGEGLGYAFGAGCAGYVEGAVGTEAPMPGWEAGSRVGPGPLQEPGSLEQQQQQQQEVLEAAEHHLQQADVLLASPEPHALLGEPAQHHAFSAPSHGAAPADGQLVYGSWGAAEDGSDDFFAEAGEVGQQGGAVLFAAPGSHERGVPGAAAPSQHSSSGGGAAAAEVDEPVHEVHEVDRVVSDLVSSLEPQEECNGWGEAEHRLHGDVAAEHGGAAPRAQAAALLAALLHSAQSEAGPVQSVGGVELEQALALVAAALGRPGAAAAHASPTKSGGGDDAAALLTPQRPPGWAVPSASPRPIDVPGAEEGGSPPPAAYVQVAHHTPDYHAPGRGEREAREGAADTATEADMQGDYDLRLAARTTVLEAELVTQVAATAIHLELKFEAKLAERARGLEAKFEADVVARAAELEARFQRELLALRGSLHADYEQQLAAKEAALAEKEALEAVALEVAARELEVKFESEVAARASMLEAKFESELLALRRTMRAEYDEELAAKEAALAEKEALEAAALEVAARALAAKFEPAVAARASKLEAKFESELLALRAAYELQLAEKEAALEQRAAALEEAALRCSDMQEDQDQLLLCLGQESRKVADLSQAMQEAGLDVDSIIAPIEEEYAMMDELPQDA